ncbi:hypothetical protein, partial [Chryseobacterium sp. CH25]|uniref:hypothetical protein n=1 Tax=Chryseobacterium sp. CH25 TaxID=713559 RepID=UPI001E5866AA
YNSAELEALKLIVQNPLGLEVYYHDREIAETVSYGKQKSLRRLNSIRRSILFKTITMKIIIRQSLRH